MKRTVFLFALLAALGLMLGGCSSSTNSPDPTANLEDFGSYTTAKEQPAFGDPFVEAVMDGEEAYNDPIAVSPAVDSIENDDSTAVYCFRMIWGNLQDDSGITESTDWSGSLSLSRGAIVVTHTIRFEPLQDYIMPRYDDSGNFVPETLGWVSKTSVGFDGIAARLIIPPSVTDDTVIVTYGSAQLTISFPITVLDDLDTLINISLGNAISFQANRCESGPDIRSRGHVIGRWGQDENGQGVFYGRWMTTRGLVVGAVKGEWGVDSTGAQIFVGKWIDRTGNFEGFIKGVWRDRGQGKNAAGQFRGRIFNALREPIGVVKGHFKKGTTRWGGFFAGKWCVGDGCFALGW